MARTDRVPRGNERLDFMSRLVSPFGTKGLLAGRKRPQTLLSWFEAQPEQKALKICDKKARSFSVISGRHGRPICPGSRLGRDKKPERKVSFLLVNMRLCS
jgi:hypothetical protein